MSVRTDRPIVRKSTRTSAGAERSRLALERNEAMIDLDGRKLRLTNLRKVFWPSLGISKGALIQYYARIAPALLPHLRHRAMVMKRYPNGVEGKFFFMKRAPTPRPDWMTTCAIAHGSGSVIDFPVVTDLASLIWIVNLGCIDLNPWYARCDDVHRPDYLHFDLDPGSATFEQVSEVALHLRELLEKLAMPSYAKTSGSKGLHVYVPIHRGPLQKDVWTVAKALSREMAEAHPRLVTSEYRIANRPAGRVLIDYNQNAWGRTLASVYSVRPHPRACVSTPVTWEEVEHGVHIEDFHIGNVAQRVAQVGDLWAPLAPEATERFDLALLNRAE
jgi:bifunctional non-homologous end joining protein LigD